MHAPNCCFLDEFDKPCERAAVAKAYDAKLDMWLPCCSFCQEDRLTAIAAGCEETVPDTPNHEHPV